MGSTQPNPTHVGWVGLGWVEFFLTHHGRLGQKILLTRPMHTPTLKLLEYPLDPQNTHKYLK